MPVSWGGLILENHWRLYEEAINALEGINVPFVLGGAFGLAGYTGRLRNTKDLDFFVLDRDHERAVAALTERGFSDYYPKLAYDRSWIYRSTKEDVLVDIIWQTPNHRSIVEPDWFEHGRKIILRGRELKVIPAEELLWIKLYVMQRDRCDWPDLINLLHATVDGLDWDRLIRKIGSDLPLLKGLTGLYAWTCPGGAASIPEEIRKKLGIPELKAGGAAEDVDRIRLLDSRPWFAAHQPAEAAMIC